MIESFSEWMSNKLNEVDKVNEAPEAHVGEWGGGTDMNMLGKKVSDILYNKLLILHKENNYTFCIKKDNSSAFVLDNEKVVVLYLKMSKFGIDSVNKVGLQTNMIKINNDIKKEGITKTLYNLIIQHFGIIVCDYDQYDGARALWKSLGRSNNNLYTYNEVTDVLTSVNNFDNDSLWSFNNSSKRYLLLVISKNKLSTNPVY